MDGPWITLLTNFGLATMILIACGWAFWQTSCWIGREIIVPTRDHVFSRITQFFDRVDTTLAKLEQSIENMNSNLEHQTAALEAVRDHVAKNAVMLAELQKTVANMGTLPR